MDFALAVLSLPCGFFFWFNVALAIIDWLCVARRRRFPLATIVPFYF
jgi:hypothetical protein